MPNNGRRDLVILGGGAGGLVVASVASQLGLAVTLIEVEERLGGDCLHYGCVPSKTLIRSAKIASLLRHAGEYGLESVEPRIDLGRVMDRVAAVIGRIQQHDDPARFRGYGCEVLFGRAAFIDPHTVEFDGRRIAARRFVIATGSHPALPPIPGLAGNCLTNQNIFTLRELPERLVVLGGGPIGVEMAQAFARLGADVTIVEMGAQLLANEDPEIVAALVEALRADGITLHTGTRAESVSGASGALTVHCSGGVTLQAERILAATGRRPNIGNLGLERIGVTTGAHGIIVDNRQRSTIKHIYAVGDVCGPHAFTHMAEYQAGIVISNAVFRFPKRVDYNIVPRVTYTDPELAHVGLTEAEARERGITPQVLRFPFKDIDRALTDNQTVGMTKLVAHRGRILGASIVGPHAGELLHEIVLAMQSGARLKHLSAAIHAYPTLAQIHRRTANSAYAATLYSPRIRSIVKWINRLLP